MLSSSSESGSEPTRKNLLTPREVDDNLGLVFVVGIVNDMALDANNAQAVAKVAAEIFIFGVYWLKDIVCIDIL